MTAECVRTAQDRTPIEALRGNAARQVASPKQSEPRDRVSVKRLVICICPDGVEEAELRGASRPVSC